MLTGLGFSFNCWIAGCLGELTGTGCTACARPSGALLLLVLLPLLPLLLVLLLASRGCRMPDLESSATYKLAPRSLTPLVHRYHMEAGLKSSSFAADEGGDSAPPFPTKHAYCLLIQRCFQCAVVQDDGERDG